MIRQLSLAALAVICLLTGSRGDETFNVYEAIKAGTSLTDAMPVITSIYPDLDGWKKDLFKPYDGGATLVVSGRYSGHPIFFLFCSGVLSGAMAPISAENAAQIVSGAEPPTTVFVNREGVMLSYPQLQVGLDYLNSGTPESVVMLVYPVELALRFDFEGRCSSASRAE